MLMTPNCRTVCGLSSTLSLATRSLPAYSAAISSTTGAIMWQVRTDPALGAVVHMVAGADRLLGRAARGVGQPGRPSGRLRRRR